MLDLKNKRVTVMGIGVHGGGIGTIKFLVKEGAEVCATDLRDEKALKSALEQLKDLPIQYPQGKSVRFVLGKHEKEDFINADLIVKNPAVPLSSPWLAIARENGVIISSDIGLFVERNPAFTIGITGTKGKSTTASLIAHILKTAGLDVFLAGNIRRSVLDILSDINKDSVVVLELSSWQLEDLEGYNWSPKVAVFLNLLPDHLNRYASMEEYGQAKKRIFKFQTENDFLVANLEDEYVKRSAEETKSRIIFFTKTEIEESFLPGEPSSRSFASLPGEHNARNIAAALAAIEALISHKDSPANNISTEIIKKALTTFKPPEGRLEESGLFDGIRYINDTAATTPEAVCAALNSFPREKIILIAGGENKGLSYKLLSEEIATGGEPGRTKGIKFLVLLDGSASYKIAEELRAVKWGNFKEGFTSMQEAVNEAKVHAERGDIVLLSPGAASFNLFAHEFDRGNQFKESIG